MTGDPTRASIGEYLAQQRKLRGISVDELCELTKLPRRNIERLESGALDGQADGFVRGFVRTVAIALGLDPNEAVMRLMQEPDPDPGPESGWLRTVPLRWIGAALATLLLVLLWKLGSDWWSQRADAEASPPLLRRHDVVGELVRERDARAAVTERAEPALPAPVAERAEPALPAPVAERAEQAELDAVPPAEPPADQ